MTLGDIYYVLFRQKWKIIFFSAMGVLAAAALFLVKRPAYQSEAKILIRYVMDSKSLNPAGAESKITQPNQQGDSIINTEVEILTSFDLVQQVVEAIGAEKILAKSGGGTDLNQTADLVISKNLTIEVTKNSSVIRIVFQHPDPKIVQPVLSQLIEKYLKKHVDIHQAVGVFDDFLRQQTDQLKLQLAQTEQELQKARSEAGVISLADTKKVYTDQISKIRQELFDAEAELAERQAALKDLTERSAAKSDTATNARTAVVETPVVPVDEYKSVCSRLDLLWRKQQELLTQFTEESVPVKEVREQIAEVDVLKKKLQEEYPQLASLNSTSTTAAGRLGGPLVDPSNEFTRVAALKSKIRVLNSQLDQIRTEAVNGAAGEATIQELQRKRELEEANYRHFSASLEQSRFDEALGAGKVSNISVVQAPTPPLRAKSKIYKMMAGTIFGGLFFGLALAFFIELKFDQSVRRPIDVETKVHLPLFLSIPYISANSRHRLAQAARGEPLLLKGQEGEALATVSTAPPENDRRPEISLWNRSPALRHFFEALRDRLIVDFEVRNLTHKPKLLAVTSCGKDSGVTTVAVGLAACLSETGDGNVLLVDMSHEKAAAQQFWKGKSVCGLNEALYNCDRAQVQDNLYVVTEKTNGESRPRNLPQLFTQLVPKIKASNYDYIIFDMPPISQTSVTPRLAAFMDQVLLVIESEKTDRERVQRASALLAESKAGVCAVLNKTRTYVPPSLHQGSLSDT
jgi:succinoglycan biosynthesis transport protein ExoP